MTTASRVVFQKEDGTSEWIAIEPVSHEEDDQTLLTGVYILTASPDTPEAAAGNDPIESIAAGELVIHREDKYDWLYVGDYLNDEEQEQVVRAIQAELD